MGAQDKSSHYVKQVKLPDGKLIDVVYFDDNSDQIAVSRDDLHICPKCGSDFVYPLDWVEVSQEMWAVEVRCPECEWIASGVFDQESVDKFDRELDRGVDALIDDLQRLERSNMIEDMERFIDAIHDNQILPVDF